MEDSCYGVWNDSFPKFWPHYPDSSSPDTIPVFEPDTLFTAVHYLGAPVDTVKTYFLHSYDCNGDTCYDILYREYDHGVVFAHYGTCSVIIRGKGGYGGDYIPYQWVDVNLDSIDVEESRGPCMR